MSVPERAYRLNEAAQAAGISPRKCRRWMSKLGFGPTERSKLKVPDAPKENSGFAKFKR